MLVAWIPGLAAQARCGAPDIRWSAAEDRLTVSGPVVCTLSELRAASPDEAPLSLVSPGVWRLDADLVLEGGATLHLVGTALGGDVDELRLRSDNREGEHAFVELRAEWGEVRLVGTRVTSWDTGSDAPDTETDNYGRAFVRVISYLDGATPRVSRMDVVDSDVGHLGYYAAESYGLTWKVRGSSPGLFDLVDVLGEVTGSTIHHNYFGMYTYGAHGMRIVGNEFSDNVRYGVDPHDDSDALLVEANSIHDNGGHGFICSKRCDGLVVRGNDASWNGGAGFMFHAAVTGSVLEGNVAEHNGDAGFALVDSHDNVIRGNLARDNLDGLRLCAGASENVVTDNMLTDNARHGVNLYVGSTPPTVNDGRPTANLFRGNDASRNGELGVRAKEAFANELHANTFADNGTWDVALVDATDNLFAANELAGGWFYAEGGSVNEIADTGSASVRLRGPLAAMTFTDSTGRVFAGEDAIETIVSPAGSAWTATGSEGDTDLELRTVALAVAPTGGDVRVRLRTWAPLARAWSTAPGTAAIATFEVGELAAGARYAWSLDGEPRGVLIADATGSVRIRTQVGDAPHEFALRQAKRPGERRAPAGRWVPG